jgi:hypothetical protein
MALTPEQRAIVQLLLKGRQGYAEIAAIVDVAEQDARRRARQAVGELGGADPDEHVGLTDYLLGQADPIGRADAVRHLQSCERCHGVVEEALPKLQLLASDAELPTPPPLRSRPSRQAAPDSEGPREPRRAVGPSLGSLPPRQVQLLAGLVAALVAVGIVVLVVSGGDDKGSSRAGNPGTTATSTTATPSFVRVPLRATGGGSGSGVAVFSIQGRQVVLDIQARGLTPSPQGRFYVAWLYNSNSNSFPLATASVGSDGKLSISRAISSQVAAQLPGVRSVDVSLEKASTQLPTHRGPSVLRGNIPGGPGTTAGGSGSSGQ